MALCRVDGAALVIGSTQPAETVDTTGAGRKGVEVTRRAAGGGAVLVAPGAQVWIDAWVPRGDPLWDDDVVRSAGWLGDAWASALCALGARQVEVHSGPSVDRTWSRLVCFAGLGPGEVTTGGAKVVGLAQRRTKEGARFLTVAHLSWNPSSIVDLLALRTDEKKWAVADLSDACLGLVDLFSDGEPSPHPLSLLESVEGALLQALP